MTLQIDHVLCLKDNYVWLLREPQSGQVAVVDPSEAAPVKAKLDALGWKLTHILNTHHHWDHTGGNLELKQATGATIVGPTADRDRIPGIDVAVGEGETYRFGAEPALVFDIPGHTRGHIAFWFSESDALFCGDTLFTLGCGRVMESTFAEMWSSLSRLAALPDEARVYSGHDYVIANGKFALAVEPDNAALKARMAEAEKAKAEGRFLIPSTIGEEKATNPFLRAGEPSVARAVKMEGADPGRVFQALREWKNRF